MTQILILCSVSFIFGSYSHVAGSRLRWNSRKRTMYWWVSVSGIRLILNSHRQRQQRPFLWHRGILSVTANLATFLYPHERRSSQSSARALILVKSRVTPSFRSALFLFDRMLRLNVIYLFLVAATLSKRRALRFIQQRPKSRCF